MIRALSTCQAHVVLTAVALLLVACSTDRSVLDRLACDDDSDCGPGEWCTQGFCRSVDAMGSPDTRDDTSLGDDTDTSEPPMGCGESAGACGAHATCCGANDVCAPGDPGCFCVDTSTSNEHCGACGERCGPEQVCVLGTCQCTAGRGDCDGDASNGCEAVVIDDNANCGTCGRVCPAGASSCSDGACLCDGRKCGEAQDCCDVDGTGDTVVCVDIQSSVEHCGACGNACGEGESCVDGQCICGTTAVASGEACPVAGQACCDDACVPSDDLSCVCGPQADNVLCMPEQRCCPKTAPEADQMCTPVLQNPSNCGDCGVQCVAPRTSCVGGTCQCPSDTPELCTDAGGDVCVDTASDPAHCGACGAACGAGEICCGGGCVDPMADAQHCGACGQVCMSGTTCQAGACGCPSGMLNDDANCGTCGVACTASQDCADTGGGNFVCTVTCPANFLDCDGNPGNGCETAMRDDDSCGNSCDTIVDCGFEEDEECMSDGRCNCRLGNSGDTCPVVGEACEPSAGSDNCYCGGEGASLQCTSGQICIHDPGPTNFRCVTP